MKSRKFLNWKFCGSNHVGSDHTGSTTIIKEDISLHINFLQKYYFCHVRNIYLFNNLLFLSQIELLSLKFLFKHFYSNAPFSFSKVFSKNVCNLPLPLSESDSAFSKTQSPQSLVLISNVRMPEWIFLVTSWRYAFYLTRLEHNRYNEISQPTPLPLINPFSLRYRCNCFLICKTIKMSS